MTRTAIVSAAALVLGLGFTAPAVYAQDGAHLNDPAQLQREHNRAKAAGDWANDPYNPTSSNDLNRRQLDRANAAGNGPAGYVYSDTGEAMPANAEQEATAPSTADSGATYSSDQQYSDQQDQDSNTTVTVLAPPHTVNEAWPGDRSPQSTGTPSIDTPYAVPPGTYVAPDQDSSGMYQPPAK